MPVIRPGARPGVVYTPSSVAGPMVRIALEPLLRGRTSEQVLALRVCDPAMGEGAFLVEVIEVLAEALREAWRAEGVPGGDARRAVTRCVAGVDIDGRAVAIARAALGCEERALRVGDALELDWSDAFPEAFAAGGFDAIVGNPPYIRQEWLGAGKPALQGFASYDGVADLYVYFVELAHRLARPDGRYCLITPNKWLTAAYGRPLRSYLAEQSSVEGVVDLSRSPLFAEADAFPCIVWGSVGEPRRTPIRASRVGGGVIVADALRDAGVPHPRERWRAEPWHIDAPDDRALIDRLERAWPALGDVVRERPSRGVVTGCNRAFVVDRATRDRLLAEEPSTAALLRPFVKGRDIRPWQPEHVERWILLVDRGTSLDGYPAAHAHLARFREALEPRPANHRGAWQGRKPGTYRWHELQDPVGALAASRSPRLLYQDIQTGPACSIDRSGELVPDTTVWILPSTDLFLLAVLNSSLYGWYAQRRFPPALGGSVRPKLEYIRALPIASPTAATRSDIERLVEQRIALDDERRAGDDRASRIARELDAAIDDAVLGAYELRPAERTQLSQRLT